MTSQPMHEQLARLCLRCLGIGDHYPRCPLLQLPPGYRVLADPYYEPDADGAECALGVAASRRPDA